MKAALAAIFAITLTVAAETLPTARIARFAGDRAAAISYTFDDNLRDQYTLAVPMLNEAGFKGTFFVVAGKTAETPEEGEKKLHSPKARGMWGGISWPELKVMADEGHEISSHTWSHRGMREMPPAEVEAEIKQAWDAINTRIGKPPLTLAFPFNQSTPEVQAAAMKHHVAFRSFQIGTSEKTTAKSLNAWADKLIQEKKWGVFMAHGIAKGYAALTDPEILRAHWGHVKERESDIWVDTFANVARYEKERDDAKLIVSGKSGELTCTLSSTLYAQRYDVPLTVVIDAPGVTSGTAKQGDRDLPIRIRQDAIHVDAVPGTQPFVVRWATAHAGKAVTLEDDGARIILSNGVITAKIEKGTARVVSMKFRDQEMVQPGGDIYYSMDTAGEFESPKGCVFTVKTETPDVVDVGMRRVHSGQAHAVGIEIHYVLRRGDSGLYTYALLDHPASYPATTVNEWRVVWKLPDDLLERICVDEARNWVMPSAADFKQAKPTPIKEALLMTSGVRAGLYDCKYSFNANYHDLGCWGHASDQRQLGAWAVFGSHEFFNDGPTKNDLTSAAGVIHVHFGLNHYDGSRTQIAAGEAWQKLYGPLLLYCNEGENNSASWADAKARAAREREKWPHDWLTKQPAYPLTDERGRVKGQFVIRDALKPNLKAAGAWIGLAQPEAGGNWQSESKHYQYWTRVEADGRFIIPHVRPGSYTLSAFGKGAVGDFTKQNVIVKAGDTTALGEVIWDVPHAGSRLVWEIGVPDRTAREFRHGDDYFQPFIWEHFAKEFSNPLDFTIGQSDPAKDWNYAHCAYLKDGKTQPWPWRIHFKLDALPQSGDATLTVAIAGYESSHLQVFVNDSRKAHVLHRLPGFGSNALFRQGIHGKYEVARIAIPVSKLRTGDNMLTLLTTRHDGQASHLMYDYLSLEMPTP